MKYSIFILLLIISGCKSSENYKSFFDSKYKDQKLKLLIVPLINKNENGKLLNQYEEPGLIYKTKDSSSFDLINTYLLKLKEISRFNSVDICFSNKFELNPVSEFLEVNKKKTIEIRRLSYNHEELKQCDIILYLNMRILYRSVIDSININDLYKNQFPVPEPMTGTRILVNKTFENIIYDISFVYEETKTQKILFYRNRDELTFETNHAREQYLAFYLVRDTPFFRGAYQDYEQRFQKRSNFKIPTNIPQIPKL